MRCNWFQSCESRCCVKQGIEHGLFHWNPFVSNGISRLDSSGHERIAVEKVVFCSWETEECPILSTKFQWTQTDSNGKSHVLFVREDWGLSNTVEPISVDTNRFQWKKPCSIRERLRVVQYCRPDSSGHKLIPMKKKFVQYCRPDSSGHQWIPVDTNGFQWTPMDSSGGVHTMSNTLNQITVDKTWSLVESNRNQINWRCIVQGQKISIPSLPPSQKDLIFLGVGGSVRPKNLKKCLKLSWNFQGCGVS